MKKYTYIWTLLLLAVLSFTACSEEEGTNPGNDSKPAVTLYTYEPGSNYNADNDVKVRIATNSKTAEAYYLAEPKADQEKNLQSMGEAGYEDYVIQKGKKVESLSPDSAADVIITNLTGAYTITAVAINGNDKAMATASFTGLAWEDVAEGTYEFGTETVTGKGTPANKVIGKNSVSTTLQICTTDATLYRFKDLYGEGNSLKINLLDLNGKDNNGTFQYFRIPAYKTPVTFGNYGNVYVMDVGYWQSNEAFITDGGYQSNLYEDHSCAIMIAYTVVQNGKYAALGYGYDYFTPDTK